MPLMYGQVLPDGRAYFYDPQMGGGKALTYEQIKQSYKDVKTDLMKGK